MGLTDIKKELKNLDKDQLINLIADLYKNNKSVKEYFDFYVNSDSGELFEKYREKIFNAFFPKRGTTYKLKDGKQAITDFKKNGGSADLVADLMLFYVEMGVEFTNNYGDINESFYKSVARMYLDALILIKKENLLDKFYQRSFKAVHESDGIGWGFHDFLWDTYVDFYPEEFGESIEPETKDKEAKIIKLGGQ